MTRELALTPLNSTEVRVLKPPPFIVTTVPAAPDVGVNDVIAGLVSVKIPKLVAVPPGENTEINPEVAFVGTVTVN